MKREDRETLISLLAAEQHASELRKRCIEAVDETFYTTDEDAVKAAISQVFLDFNIAKAQELRELIHKILNSENDFQTRFSSDDEFSRT